MRNDNHNEAVITDDRRRQLSVRPQVQRLPPPALCRSWVSPPAHQPFRSHPPVRLAKNNTPSPEFYFHSTVVMGPASSNNTPECSEPAHG
ncbi:hypothetical protein AAFF_G00440340 [Aldrovandia affinis]|uniref:Uncharacterized protein n=1 Tax=Aldrovandia affinis TaxID=143900 RepID=A0AAD7WHV1_9TELE|nr:hypothetical protein AAFF_G00440340 [Aldrovandia affinis]